MTETLPEVARDEYLADRAIHKMPRRWWLSNVGDMLSVGGEMHLANLRLVPMSLAEYDMNEKAWRKEFIRWRGACIDQNSVNPDMRDVPI